MNAGTLSNKANPNAEHQPTLRDTIVIQRITEDYRILNAYAFVLGHSVFPIDHFHRCSDIEVLDLYAQWHEQIGEKASSVRRALSDGQITRREFQEIKDLSLKCTQAQNNFVNRLRGLVK